MEAGERRLLVMLGLGSVVLSAGIVSLIEKLPEAWATHRSAPTFGGSNPIRIPDGCEPLPVEGSVRPAGFEEFPSFLLEAGADTPWSFEFLNEGTVTSTVDKEIVVGDNVFEFSMGGGCTFKYGITGIARGESIVMEGPCQVDLGVTVPFVVKFVDPSTNFPEVPDVQASPVVDAMSAPQSEGEWNFRRRVGSTYKPNDVFFLEKSINISTISSVNCDIRNGIEVQFNDEGFYEVERIWTIKAPPKAAAVVKIGRVTTNVIAGEPNDVAAGMGISISDLFDFFDAPGPSCVSTQTVGGALMVVLGTIRCDKITGYASVVDKASIGIDVQSNAGSSISTSDLNAATNIVIDAIAKHEAEHVTHGGT